MSIETVTPAASTPEARPELDTSNIEDYNSRIHAVYEDARATSKAERIESDADEDAGDDIAPPADDGEEVAADATPKAKAKEAPVAAAPAAPSADEIARKASLANAARLERESVKRSTELAAKAAEIKLTEAKFAERESKLAAFEKAYNDPDALLALLADKVTPEKMSQFFIEAGQPDKVAERRAKAALAGATEPVNAEVAKLREEMKAIKAEADAAKAQVARAASEKDFAARTLEIKDTAPHAARLLAKRPKDFYQMADVSATQIMAKAQAEGRTPSWDDVIHDVEKQLSDFARDLQDEGAGTHSTHDKLTKTPAAAKAPTVSNRAASERSSIVSDDEKWESLPYEERVRRAEKRARLA